MDSPADYREYTTAELRAMPDTARLEDRGGRVYWPSHVFNTPRFIYQHDKWNRASVTPYELARRKLRRIA